MLSLKSPKGSRQQIIYSIGSFQHLADFGLIYDFGGFQGESAGNPSLIPLFIPPLRGWLTLTNVTGIDILKDMTTYSEEPDFVT